MQYSRFASSLRCILPLTCGRCPRRRMCRRYGDLGAAWLTIKVGVCLLVRALRARA